MLWSTEHLYEGPNLSIHLNLNKILNKIFYIILEEPTSI